MAAPAAASVSAASAAKKTVRRGGFENGLEFRMTLSYVPKVIHIAPRTISSGTGFSLCGFNL
jgi:hypothetical protein